MTSITSKPERLEYRTDSEIKDLVVRAAKMLGLTETSFAISALTERAKQVIEEFSITRLSARDWDAVNALLASDSKPSKRLKQAAKKFKKSTRE